jgi:hypothetical protein
MSDPSERFVTVHTLTNQFEADVLSQALEQEHIPILLRGFEETAYDGLFVKQKGWGWLQVPETLEAKAREVITRATLDLERRGLYEDPDEIDPYLWEQLAEADPDEICVRAMVQYDAEDQTYLVPFLNASCACNLEARTILTRSGALHRAVHFELYLVILHYLLEATPQALSGRWISEKDIPGGELFFRGPHQFPTAALLRVFGRNRELFRRAAESLGASPVPMGDAAYRLWPLPRVPILFVLWDGDDEFEPALHVRFDTTVSTQLLTLDTLWALVNVVSRNLRGAAKDLLNS